MAIKTKNMNKMSIAITFLGLIIMVYGLISLSNKKVYDFDKENTNETVDSYHYYFGVAKVVVNVYTKNETFIKAYPLEYENVENFNCLGKEKTNDFINELGLRKTKEVEKLLLN